MKFINSRNLSDAVNFSQAILSSLPSKDGLYIPSHFPHTNHIKEPLFANYADQFISTFFEDDPFIQRSQHIKTNCFSFSPRITALDSAHHLLELFHGPSLSFKDFGAQFLAQCLDQIPQQKKRLIIVATSGDTGSAVAAAFHQKPDTQVFILYPNQGVSARQAHQLGCWGDNITTLAVDDTFDRCQALVKIALADSDLAEAHEITTANSINIGRLLPQVAYYAYSSNQYAQQHQRKANIIVPSGNLGNVTACCWARTMGHPIGHIVIAQNENKSVVDYCQSGKLVARPSVKTLANAMDVGAPSNFLRLQALYPNHKAFCQQLSAYSISDEEIINTITHTHQKNDVIICPHTATAVALLPRLTPLAPNWLIAATAHPAKFETVIEPLIDQTITLPERLQRQLKRTDKAIPMQASIGSLKDIIFKRAS